MAQAGYTPIQLYYSTTVAVAPSAGDLSSGELAINITDGKLFYKDNGGVVQVLATKAAGTVPGAGIAYSTGSAWGSSYSTSGSGTTLALTNSPVLVTPNLGTPSAITLTNGSGLPVLTGISGLGSGVATFLATPSSANLASAVTDETGSGALVFATSPSLTTPTLGVATATSINKLAITAPATGSTLAVADGKTFTVNRTLTLTGTDATTMTFPGTNATIARTDAGQSFTGTQTFLSDAVINSLTVGLGASAVSTNTAIGASVLVGNTTGSNNVGVGYISLAFNTSGTYNAALGHGSLKFNTSGNFNTAIGYQSLAANTTTGQNVAIGALALNAATGSLNTAVGYGAMDSAAGGIYNSAVGAYALRNTANGASNVAVGYTALFENTDGGQNSAVGTGALLSNTTGAQNSAFGTGAINTSSSANNITAVGYTALQNTTASNNTAIGTYSGSAISSGSKNTIVGCYTGNQGGLDIRTLSNRIVLSDGDGNPRWYIDNNGTAGYGPTTGGTVTQATSRTTGVTINKPTGQITLVSAAGTTSWQSFTVTNSAVAATDVIIVNQDSGTDLYQIFVTNVAAGSFRITFATTGGTTTEQPVFGFAVIKGQTS